MTLDKVQSKADFDKKSAEAGKAVYFYDESPAIETYASEKETEIANLVKDVKRTPKLYVKFAQADAKSVAQTLVLEGFENDGKLPQDKLNKNLTVPTLTENEEAKTPTSITLAWNKVADATTYELLVDGVVFSVGDVETYTHTDLGYHSEHKYKVRLEMQKDILNGAKRRRSSQQKIRGKIHRLRRQSHGQAVCTEITVLIWHLTERSRNLMVVSIQMEMQSDRLLL